MDSDWYRDAVFYHIYPLGYAGAPASNDFHSDPVHRLDRVLEDIPHIAALGCNAVYFGPVFESAAHGYDTVSYTLIDRRLGDESSFHHIVDALHTAGLRVVLDGVFNHVGRDFWAFKDVLEHRQNSAFIEWFADLDFNGDNAFRDGLSYRGWEGNMDLVTLNLGNPQVKDHIFSAVTWMMDTLGIDGLRLDVAYLLDDDFITELAAFCHGKRSDFWLLGEMIHGDYRRIARPNGLDSVTNYECYKGLYSSHNDGNYYEIAWSLNRQFGQEGLYRDLNLYNFVDNHDVDRIVSKLDDRRHILPIYALLFTIPGIPSVYYGSEWLAEGSRTDHDDKDLRPWTDAISRDDGSLVEQIRLLADIRRRYPALRRGSYRQISVDHEQIVFERRTADQTLIIAVNASPRSAHLSLDLNGTAVNIFDPDETVGKDDTLAVLPMGWKILELP